MAKWKHFKDGGQAGQWRRMRRKRESAMTNYFKFTPFRTSDKWFAIVQRWGQSMKKLCPHLPL